jgi:predicted alpha-1,6-mannanase (GH76 family)
MKRMELIVTGLMTFVLMFSSGCLQENPDDDITPGTPPKEYNFKALADSIQNATYTSFLSSNGKYFIQNNSGITNFNYWWNAHALDVLVDAYIRTGDTKYKSRMTALVNGIKDTNGGTYLNDYYDDMEWLGLSSLRAYHATNDVTFLDLSKLLWSDIKTGLNTNQGGGIAWRKTQLDYKNTPANAPAIILACRLYAIEQNSADLQLAKDVYTWLKNTLVDPSTGLAWDGINRTQNGQIDKWMFTYNQGVWIGAGLELYRATNEQSYLNDAIKAADYVINDVQFFPNGIMKAEGNGDGGLFKGILVRYLTVLSKDINVPKTKRDKYSGVINFNAKTLFDKGIKRPAMLIGPDWTQKPGSSTDLSAQLSGLMLIEAVASYED